MSTEIIKNMYRHDLSSFTGFSHQVLNPHAPYLDNWHMQVMADVLTKVSRGEITRLIINLPPRMGKSLCASVAFPAWMLGRDPTRKIICLTGGKTLGQELHAASSTLMGSRRYRSLFPHLRPTDVGDRIYTGHGGYRLSMNIEARMTGLGGNIIIMDDPIDALRAQDKSDRERLNEQFDQNILQRLNNKKTDAIILVMQRVHENDLTAYLLSKNEEWVHVNMPAIALQDEVWDLPHGRKYMRGRCEALHTARETAPQLVRILRSVGGYAFAYQYLQGLYKPVFGENGEGGIYVTPFREGQLWDAVTMGSSSGIFVRYKEERFILPRVFGIGEDPAPPDMRTTPTIEEWINAPNDRNHPVYWTNIVEE